MEWTSTSFFAEAMKASRRSLALIGLVDHDAQRSLGAVDHGDQRRGAHVGLHGDGERFGARGERLARRERR
jgi:hypothetical protein